MVQRSRIEERLKRVGVPFDHTDYGVRVYFTEPGDEPKTADAIREMKALGLQVEDVDFGGRKIAFSDRNSRRQGMGVSL